MILVILRMYSTVKYSTCRRRIYTEVLAKVVAASWGTELLQFLAALAILDQDDLKSWLFCTIYNLKKRVQNSLILQLVLVQNSLFFNSSW